MVYKREVLGEHYFIRGKSRVHSTVVLCSIVSVPEITLSEIFYTRGNFRQS